MQRLRRLQAKLGDVHLATDSGGLGAIDTLATIGDYLFDDWLIDWFVQAKIDRARDQTAQVYTAVRNLLAALKAQQQTMHQERANLVAQREALIANA